VTSVPEHSAASVRAAGAEDASDLPLVSCLMPTRDRRRFVPRAIRCFLEQDYPARELVIVDDGADPIEDLVPADPRISYERTPPFPALGGKRNFACGRARGDFMAHWDDDDWSAPHRLRVQVETLRRTGASFCGLATLYFYQPERDLWWRYTYPRQNGQWVAGGTLCYTRTYWGQHRFRDVQVGEDTHFVRAGGAGDGVAIPDLGLYVATIHRENTAAKRTVGGYWSAASPAPLLRLGQSGIGSRR
jgi:Glycosyl transferase family 2